MLRSLVKYFPVSARINVSRPTMALNRQFAGFMHARAFTSVVERTTGKVIEAVTEYLTQRRLELEEYAAADIAEKEETNELLEKLANVKLGATTSWGDLGLDGLDEVELVLAIEAHLQVELQDDEFHSIHSVADAVKVLEKYAPKMQ